MSRGTAFDAAREGLFGGLSEQLTGGGVGHLVTSRVDLTAGAADLVWGEARDLVWGGAGDQLAGGGPSVWRKGA